MRHPIVLTVFSLLAALVPNGTASAQTSTTTTSTSTSTTTTMHPHEFSPETKQCVAAAKAASRQCPGTKEFCLSQYEAAFAQCFAGAAGQQCATKCEQSLDKCLAAVPTTRSKCLSTCRTNRKKDAAACRRIAAGDFIWTGGDQGCLITKDVNFAICKFQCNEAMIVCHTNFRFCIANCPNL